MACQGRQQVGRGGDFRQVPVRQHGEHTAGGLRGTGVDADHPPAGRAGADEGGIRGAGQRELRCVAAASGDFGGTVDAGEGRPTAVGVAPVVMLSSSLRGDGL